MPVLVFVLFVVPIVELAIVVRVADAIGLGDTIGLLILVSLAGGWLMKREGVAAWRRLQAELASGQMPGRSVVDGAMILFGGALLLTPGFLTDAVGLALLLPPVRALLRRFFVARVRNRVTVLAPGRWSATGGGWPGPRRPPQDEPRGGPGLPPGGRS